MFLVLGGATFMYKAGADYSRGAFVFAWALALVLVPLGRAVVRELFARKPWWGVPVLVLGAGKTGEVVVRALERQPGLGLKPVAVLDDDPSKHGRTVGAIRVEGSLDLAERYAQAGVKHAILAMPGVPRNKLLDLLEKHGNLFPNLIVVPDLFGLSSLWVASRDIGGLLGLEIRQNLLRKGPRLIKRTMDVGLIFLSLPVILLVSALLALLVRLDSRGPVFYAHLRVGQGRKLFRAWKFRTMAPNAEDLLARYLRGKPSAQGGVATRSKAEGRPPHNPLRPLFAEDQPR
ncbi:MAG: sugar transferase [Meiothermus sp.]|uniref:sugar transferase n=1 Tax=Meiothermus sp. TaxID=1955249 RepID=UPI00298F2AF3|nr:sugar transferase [Meiothermus sp.]MDW8482511.1 sugar transferase [Meiothermus sp.]